MYEENKVDIPSVNIKADLLLLENTEEYKHLKNLEKVELGDTVSCTDNPLNITFESRVIRVKKDVLLNRNVEVELGQFKNSISHTLNNIIKDISEDIRQNTSSLEKAIENATELLTNALGGHVLKRPGELLIMDTDNPETAQKVWRWNLNGLGYSDSGINGPYGLAMTMDGQIVADFITTGTLDASLIKAGTIDADAVQIKSANQKLQIDGPDGLTVRNTSNNIALQLGHIDTTGNGTKDDYGLKANHSDGGFSAMVGSGFLRKYLYGEVSYLNGIYIAEYEYLGDRQFTEPPPVRMTLPQSFRGRGSDVKIFTVPTRFAFDGNETGWDPDIEGRQWIESALRYHTLVNNVSYINLSSAEPYVDVTCYTTEQQIDMKTGVMTDVYYQCSFILIVIGS